MNAQPDYHYRLGYLMDGMLLRKARVSIEPLQVEQGGKLLCFEKWEGKNNCEMSSFFNTHFSHFWDAFTITFL